MDDRYYRTEADLERGRDSGSRVSRLFSHDSGRRAPQPPPQSQYPSGGSNGVVFNSPSTYEDVQLLIDHLKMREQVIVNFTSVNQTSVYRILDFMSGAIYALGGSIQQITNNIFLFAPAGVTITIPPQFRR